MLSQQCPTFDELSRYSLGYGDAPRREEIAGHVDGCAACQASIATVIDSSDTLVAAIRHMTADDPYSSEPQRERVLARIAALGREPSFSADAGRAVLPSATQAPRTIRDYRLLAKLGEGGMGAVYKALHVKLDKIVALKILPTSRMRDEAAIARFDREMKAVGRLQHPNIVGAMDAGEDQGTHYLVMEYVEGLDLSSLARRVGRLGVADACELVRQSADGLQHAHEHGMVHRDIKPSNLILTTQGRLKVLDLGLALLSENSGQPGEELTSTGQMMGTLDYMAPEQGKSSQVDIRADIYALGATLYRLLSGQAPFSGEQYNTPVKKMMALATEDVPSLGTKRDDLPVELITIADKMLAKNPHDRFATPKEVAEALASMAAGADLETLLRGVADESPEMTSDQSAVATRESLKSSSVETDPTIDLKASGPTVDDRVADRVEPKQPDESSLQRPHVNHASVQRGKGARPWAIAVAVGGLVLLGAIVLYFKTNNGTIAVEIDDPTIQVSIEGEELTITKNQTGESYRVRAGHKLLHVTRGELHFSSDQFELRRGERVVLTVKLVDGEVQVKRVAGKDTRIIGRGELPSAPTRPIADRAAAEWALSIGGSVALDVDGTVEEVNRAAALPSGAWTVRSIKVHSRQVTDADLKVLTGLTHLRALELDNSRVTDDGLKKLAGLSQLQSLSLWLAKITDSGLKELVGLKQLQSLDLSATQVTDVGVRELAGFKNLEELNLSATRVTDASLKEFSGLKQLRFLGLNGTTVSGTAFKELAGLEQLHTLNLNGTQIKDEGLRQLAGLTQLRSLWLNTSPATAEGLAELARLKNLMVLILYSNDVTDGLLNELAGMTELRALAFDSPLVTDDGLQKLTGLTKLQELRVNCPNVTDAGLTALARLKQLRALALNNTQVTNAGLEELVGIKQLKSLFLRDTQVTDEGLKVIARYGNLSSLDLSGNRVTEAGVAELKRALRGCLIESGPTDRSAATWGLSNGGSVTLDVGGTKVEVSASENLPPNPWRLHSVTVPNATQVTDADLKELAGLTNLRGLKLNNSQVTDSGLRELAQLSKLETLSLWGAKMTDAGLKELSGLTNLRDLNVSATQVTNGGLKNLARFKQLRALALLGTRVTDAGFKELSVLTQLQNLGLGSTQVTGAGFQELAGLKRLEALWLDGTHVTDAGLKELAQLKHLLVLSLWHTQVTDAGLKELGALKKMRVLSVNSPKVTDRGLRELAGLTELRELHLSSPQITDAGLKELATLNQLHHLDLNEIPVTDTGLKELANLQQLQQLRLQGTRVTEAGINDLKQALPGCKISSGSGDDR